MLVVAGRTWSERRRAGSAPPAIALSYPLVHDRQPPRRCRPQFVLLNNINLPDHAGWFREHLLQAGLWREGISGYLEDANSGGNALKLHGNASLRAIYERRRWTLLVRTE